MNVDSDYTGNNTSNNLEVVLQEGQNSGIMLLYKTGIILFLFTLTFMFGFLPIKVKNTKLIGIANAFSGGIFLCVALLHLLPESTEIFNEYFEQSSHSDHSGHSHDEHDEDHLEDERHFPMSFLLAFCGYTLILMLEKIIFDSHTHQLPDEEEHENNNDNEHENNNEKEKSAMNVNVNVNVNINVNNYKIPSKYKNESGNTLSTSSYLKKKNLAPKTSLDEMNFNSPSHVNENVTRYTKTILSSKRGSFSTMSKGKRDRINSYLETFKIDSVERKEEHFKNLFTTTGKISSMLLVNDQKNKFSRKRDSAESEFTNKEIETSPMKSMKSQRKEPLIDKEYPTSISPKETITSYLLLLALSIHACFEGIAIGLQESPSEIFYMFLAISFHKWVEALSIGINLSNSKIERSYLLKFIILFSLMTPLGMIFGIIFSGFSEVVEATFLSISAGSFIYISTSEIVIEEFSVSRFKNQKFFGFLTGAAIICFLTIFEHHH